MPNQDQVMGLVRTVLALISGFAIAHGVSDQTWQLVSGGVLALVPLIWTYFVHTDSAKLAAVEALPDVKKIVVGPSATDGVEAAVKDATRPKVVSTPPGDPQGRSI